MMYICIFLRAKRRDPRPVLHHNDVRVCPAKKKKKEKSFPFYIKDIPRVSPHPLIDLKFNANAISAYNIHIQRPMFA